MIGMHCNDCKDKILCCIMQGGRPDFKYSTTQQGGIIIILHLFFPLCTTVSHICHTLQTGPISSSLSKAQQPVVPSVQDTKKG